MAANEASIERPQDSLHDESTVGRRGLYPPAIAPMISNGSLPLTTASGRGLIRRVMRQVFFAGEEAQERAALVRHVIADGAAQHGIACFQRVEHRARRQLARRLPVAPRRRRGRGSAGVAEERTRIMAAFAPRPRAPAESRARSATNCRRRRARRRPARRSYRSRCRSHRACPPPSRRAAR